MNLAFLFETLLKIPKGTFQEVYGTDPNTTISNQEFKERQKHTSEGVYIHDCVFSYCIVQCALYFENTVKKLLVEQSTFFSCDSAYTHGGAIYFSSTANCALTRICGFNCSSTSSSNNHGQFAYMNIGLSDQYINFLECSFWHF